MFFTPNKRGRDFYRFNMMFLYMFAVLFAFSAVIGLFSFETDLSERLLLASIFSVIALICWKLGRGCSKVARKLTEQHQDR